MVVLCICTFHAPNIMTSHAHICMVFIYLWNTHSILTSKSPRHDVHTCDTFIWHINIANNYGIVLCIIHIHIVDMLQMRHSMNMIHVLHILRMVHMVHMLHMVCMGHMVNIYRTFLPYSHINGPRMHFQMNINICWQMWSKYKHISNAHVLYSYQSHAIEHGHNWTYKSRCRVHTHDMIHF